MSRIWDLLSAIGFVSVLAAPTQPVPLVGGVSSMTYIPNDVTRVQVTYRAPQQFSRPHRRTITQRGSVHQLVAVFNALPLDTRGPHGCLADKGERAILAFSERNGGTLSATINPACNSVDVPGHAPLFDKDNHLWIIVRTLMGSDHKKRVR